MAISIDGDSGISGVNGSATTPALQGTDSNTGIVFGTDTVQVATGGSTRATVDSSGHLGIGTASPSYTTHINSSGATSLGITTSSGSSEPQIVLEDTAASDYFALQKNGQALTFKPQGSEAMRIDASGQFLVGTTALPTDDNTALGFGVSSAQELRVAVNNGQAAMFKRASSAGTIVEFRRDGAVTGSISVTTSNTTSYNTSSDYRLKENVVDLDAAITRVKQLQPKRFNFIVDANTTVDGFLAHEAQTVVPEAVTGTHNEVDDDDNPVYQGIDQSKLVPLLTAALQEAIGKIETLETKVAALEAAE